MKRIVYTLLLVCFCLTGNSQVILFLKEYGDHFADQKAYDVETDMCGNIYTCGVLMGARPDSIDTIAITTYTVFGTGVLIKHATDGDALWVKTFGSTCFNGKCSYYDITTDTLCNIYVCGDIFCGDLILDGDTIPTSGGKLIVKYDANGNRLWYKMFESKYADSRYGIDYSKSGYIFVGANFHDTIRIDGQYYSRNDSIVDTDPIVIKMREDGSVVWAHFYGSIANETCNSIATDDSGKFYITGSFDFSTIFGNDTVSNFGLWGLESSYLTSCDSDGTVHNARWFGYGAAFYRVTKDNNNGWFASGTQGENVVHERMDFTGSWTGVYGNSTQTGGIDPPKGYGACSDPFGNYYVTGSFDEHFSLSGIGNSMYLNSPGNRYEAYLGIYDQSGAIVDLERIPNHGYSDAGNAIAFLPPNRVLIAGEQGQASGTNDYFLAIYDVSLIVYTGKIQHDHISIYPNPATDMLTVIALGSSENSRIEMFSITGSKIQLTDILHEGNVFRINLDGMTPGIYIVRYTNGGMVMNRRVVKM